VRPMRSSRRAIGWPTWCLSACSPAWARAAARAPASRSARRSTLFARLRTPGFRSS